MRAPEFITGHMNVPSETILPCCSLHHPSTKQKIAPRKMGWAGQKGSSLAKWGHKFSGKGIHIFQIRLDSKLYLKLHSKHFINRQASSEQMFPIKNEYMIFFLLKLIL